MDDYGPRSGGRALWRRVIGAPEGKILLAGAGIFLAYALALGLVRVWRPALSHSLLTMTVTHVIGGRAAGISTGYAQDLPRWVVVVGNFVVEVFLVMLFYPLFVLSYRKLIIIEPLRDALARTRKAARAHEKQVLRWGIPGLLFFVLFPFWMTGPVVGCVIGFLIGLRPWLNLTVVLTGTGVAIVCWGVLLETLHHKLEVLGPLVPFLFVGLVLFFAVAVRIRLAFGHHAPPPEENGREEAKSDAEAKR